MTIMPEISARRRSLSLCPLASYEVTRLRQGSEGEEPGEDPRLYWSDMYLILIVSTVPQEEGLILNDIFSVYSFRKY